MILLRQDNIEQKNDQTSLKVIQSGNGSYKNCQHDKDVNNMGIYPCCYQLCCEKCFKSTQNKDGHNCALYNGSDVKLITNPVNLSRFFNAQFKKQSKFFNNGEIHNLDVIQCSVCQKSSTLYKKLKFYQCKNCNKDFCEKCQSIVHGKGKFMSHQINVIENIRQNSTNQSLFKCEIHNKIRRCLLRNKIVCDFCFKQETGKQFIGERDCTDLSMTSENVRFSQQYYNEIYHNEGNRISQTKQSLTRIYQQMIQRIEERYRWNMNQLEKTQSNLKKVFTKNINQLNNIAQQVEIITLNENKLIDILNKDILHMRIQLINQKLYQVQTQCEDFISDMNFQYKVGDKEKYETLIQQFLKCLSITKLKRIEDQSIHTNRSTVRNQLKTSRTTSRPSSNRLTNSKDNRCLSSFKKNDFSSNKQNSSFKDKSNFNKNDSNKKIEDTPNSASNTKKYTINRSLSNRLPGTKQIHQGSKNNLNFFKDKQLNLKDVKELQKAEYQDLNLNLKKLIINRKPTQMFSNLSYINKVSQRPSQNTSLQKMSNQAQNALKKQFLTKQNQKSTINSGSFLKMFETSKSKVSARKNYLLSSGQDLSENQSHNKQHKSRIQVRTSNMKMLSPQNHSQLKKRNIKQELYGSNPSSNHNFSEVQTYSKFVQSSSPPQKLSKTKKQQFSGQSKKSYQNPSLLFDKLIAVSCQKPSSQPTSQFDSKCPDQSSHETENQIQLLRSQISEFSTVMTVQSEYKNTSEIIRNIQMTSSIQVCEFVAKQDSQIKKTKARAPSTSKVLQNKQMNQIKPISTISTTVDQGKSISNPSQVLKQTSNNLKESKKNNQQKGSGNVQNQKVKKKPDFMDMRQRMRKPNYLSTRFGTNLSHVITNVKTSDTKK